MIEICKLTKRHVDHPEKLPKELAQIKIFSTLTGHGVGTIDFVETIDTISEKEYKTITEKSGDYAKFKLSNLIKYFEIEIFPEHAQKLIPDMPDCKLKDYLTDLKEGYLVLRKKY